MKRVTLFACLVLLTACSKQSDSAWLGYAEGDTAFVAAPQAGWVAHLAVQRGDAVKAGDVLFTLDDTSQTSARDQAVAAIALAAGQMTEAQANLDLTHKEFIRQSGLLRASAGTKQAYDIAKSNYEQAAARVTQITAQEAQARAALSNARYQLSERDVVARTTGRVAGRLFPHRRICARHDAGRLDPAAAERLCPLLRAGERVRTCETRPAAFRSAATVARPASPPPSPSSRSRKSSRRR